MGQNEMFDHNVQPAASGEDLAGAPTMNVSAIRSAGDTDATVSAEAIGTAPETLSGAIPEMEDEEIRYFEEDESAQEAERYSAPKVKPEKPVKPMPQIPDFAGLAAALCGSGQNPALKILACVLCGLLALIVILAATFVFCALALAIILLMVLLTLLSIGVIAGGLAGFAYAVIMLFTADLIVALIEVGLGTMLIGIVLAVCALLYEVIAAQLPKLLRFFTRWYAYSIRYMIAFLFGKSHKPTAREDLS